MTIRTLSSREIYRNPWLSLREDQIERDNAQRASTVLWTRMTVPSILPIEGDTIYLIEQFRYTIQQRALELPQGGWDNSRR